MDNKGYDIKKIKNTNNNKKKIINILLSVFIFNKYQTKLFNILYNNSGYEIQNEINNYLYLIYIYDKINSNKILKLIKDNDKIKLFIIKKILHKLDIL